MIFLVFWAVCFGFAQRTAVGAGISCLSGAEGSPVLKMTLILTISVLQIHYLDLIYVNNL